MGGQAGEAAAAHEVAGLAAKRDAVQAPLPDVAVDVVEPVAVGRERPAGSVDGVLARVESQSELEDNDWQTVRTELEAQAELEEVVVERFQPGQDDEKASEPAS